MKTIKLSLSLIFLLVYALDGVGQDSVWNKSYDFGIYNHYDLRNSSQNVISTYRVLNDGIDSLVISKMNPKIGNIANAVSNFALNYLAMIWSHELGHSLKAREVGGKFNIHNFGLPIPYTTVDLPEDIALINEAAFVTAGFEVNYLNTRKLQAQFIKQNGLWNEDLSLAFANRLMYPIYTSLVVPIDPEDTTAWNNPGGDPMYYTLLVFRNYSNEKVFMPDGEVNPELVKFYNQSNIFGSFFQLLDPQFYREVGAALGKGSKTRRPIFLLGDHNTGWTYGTLFNTSPLGYELYFQNYVHYKQNQFGLYFKYGRPYKNLGMGISMNDAIKFKKFQSDILIEAWQQDIFGTGASAEMKGIWKVNDYFGVNLTLGYKTKGYVMGKQLNDGFNIGLGLNLCNPYY